jgi:threonine dehydratase
LAKGERTTAPGGALSLADALMAPTPGQIPFALAEGLVAEVRTITDVELQRAVSFAFQRLKIVVEPGGAAAMAAVLAAKFDMQNKAVALVLTGGNVDIATVVHCCSVVTDP